MLFFSKSLKTFTIHNKKKKLACSEEISFREKRNKERRKTPFSITEDESHKIQTLKILLLNVLIHQKVLTLLLCVCAFFLNFY